MVVAICCFLSVPRARVGHWRAEPTGHIWPNIVSEFQSQPVREYLQWKAQWIHSDDKSVI